MRTAAGNWKPWTGDRGAGPGPMAGLQPTVHGLRTTVFGFRSPSLTAVSRGASGAHADSGHVDVRLGSSLPSTSMMSRLSPQAA